MSGMRRAEHTTSRRWPFWLLIAAWVSANSPQAATYAVLAWLADARSFSHQHRLTLDVAHLLAGEKVPKRMINKDELIDSTNAAKLLPTRKY